MAHPGLVYNVRKQICKQASLLTGTPPCSACSFILGTEKRQFGGGENIVFALQDHKGRAICMRIQRQFTEGTSYVLKNEVNFREAIESSESGASRRSLDMPLKGTTSYTLHLLRWNGRMALPFAGRTISPWTSAIEIKLSTQ
jgi:hypothetical protein